jgi:hypothetical protein
MSMTRRKFLAKAGAATTVAGISAAIVAPVIAGPTPDAIGDLIAEANDPLLALIGRYRAGVAAAAAMPIPIDDDAEAAQIAATFGPHLDAMMYATPPATTLAGAKEAMRLAIEEVHGFDAQADALMAAVLAYLEGMA